MKIKGTVKTTAQAILGKLTKETRLLKGEVKEAYSSADVFDAGKKAEYDAFWDSYQKNGNRRQYDYAFYNCWDDITYNPKYPIVVTSTSGYIYATNDITSTKVPITIDTATANYLFYACRALKTIPSIKVTSKVSALTGWFTLCSKLEEIYFTDDSEIANNVSFSACTKLTLNSLKSIINALKDFSGTGSEFTRKLTLSSESKAILEAEGSTAPNGLTWLEYITLKGWNS